MKFILKLLSLLLLFTLFAYPQAKDWKEIIKEASIKYADKQKDALVETYNKKAIIALYRKIYPHLNKNDKKAFKQLGSLGLNASKLNKMAADLASGDPKKVQSASESLAVEFGKQLSKQVTNPYVRKKLNTMLGGADKVKEISTVLGKAAGGDKKAIYTYTADLIINAAGGGGIVGFYRTAHGVMKFAKDAYVDSTIEDLYQSYKNKKITKEELENTIDYVGGNHVAIRDKVMAERAKKLADLGEAVNTVSDKVKKHLTEVDDEVFAQRLISGFEARKVKEEKEKKAHLHAKKMQKQASDILNRLDSVASSEYGRNWQDKKQLNLEKFIDIVMREVNADENLDVNNPLDIKMMSSLLSVKLIHGANSDKYKEALKQFKKITDPEYKEEEKGKSKEKKHTEEPEKDEKEKDNKVNDDKESDDNSEEQIKSTETNASEDTDTDAPKEEVKDNDEEVGEELKEPLLEKDEENDEEEIPDNKDNELDIVPVKITTSASYDEDRSYKEFRNIVTTTVTLSFWNVGTQVQGYGGVSMKSKVVASLNGVSSESRCAGTFSGGPNGVIRLGGECSGASASVKNGTIISAGELVFKISNPEAFSAWKK